MKTIPVLVLLTVVAGGGATLFIGSGVYDIGADTPHTKPVYWVIETLRKRSITRRATTISVPPLDDTKLLLSGGADYADMCAGCHLEPGVSESEISTALYPQPPNLSKKSDASPAEMFWTIKHGIKMTAMPAWGMTHDDQRMWAMVAFIRRLPDLTPAQYQILTARDTEDTHHEQEE